MPWVPRDLYDVMLAKLRESGAPVHVSTDVVTPPLTFESSALGPFQSRDPRVGGASGSVAMQPVTLTPAVEAACRRYAYGSRDEEAANRRVAYAMAEQARPDGAIIAAIRDGATVPAWAPV